MQKDSYQTLLNYAFRLLGMKAYTENEIERRLTRRGLKVKLAALHSAVIKVINRLKELKYLDDDKILENYFEYKLPAKPQGQFAFLHEMRKRGISIDIAKEAWSKRNIDEDELAQVLVNSRKAKFVGLSSLLRKKKIASLLASRGFSPDTVWRLLDRQ